MPTEPTHTPLKPCPFCGDPEHLQACEEIHSGSYIFCRNCLSHGPCPDFQNVGDSSKAIAAWNTRAETRAPSPVTARSAPGGEPALNWFVRETKDRSKFSENWREIWQADGKPVVCAASYDRTVDGETQTYCGVKISAEHARLIASAPAMLAALQDLVNAGDAIGGYSLEEGHESPQADFLRALTKGATAIAAATREGV